MAINGIGNGYDDLVLRFKGGNRDALAVNGQAPQQVEQSQQVPTQQEAPKPVDNSQQVPAAFGSLLTPGVNPVTEVSPAAGVEGISKAPVIGSVQNEQGGTNTLRGDGYGLGIHLPEKNGTYATNGLPYSKYKSSWIA